MVILHELPGDVFTQAGRLLRTTVHSVRGQVRVGLPRPGGCVAVHRRVGGVGHTGRRHKTCRLVWKLYFTVSGFE